MALKLEIASFLYHEVTNDPKDSGFQRSSAIPYKHTTDEFARHLDQIAKSPITPELVHHIDFARPGRHLLLTFDDGGKSALYISDELCLRGWKGHFFIITHLIGNRTFLNQNEIKYIRSCGHMIGSHSHTHPEIFKDQPFKKMVQEWQASCHILSQITSEPCISGSVAGGDISAKVLRSANVAGLRYLFTSEPWLSPRKLGECWILGRVSPKVNTSVSRVQGFAQFRGWSRALMHRRWKVFVRTILFPFYRFYIRKMTNQ